MPRYSADRELLAPIDDVWTFLAEPNHLADWWPGVSGVEPDRRGLAPGARWKLRASDSLAKEFPLLSMNLLRRPGREGMLLITAVAPRERIALQFVDDRIDAEIRLAATDADRTRVTLTLEASPLVLRRSFPRKALARLHALVQTAADS